MKQRFIIILILFACLSLNDTIAQSCNFCDLPNGFVEANMDGTPCEDFETSTDDINQLSSFLAWTDSEDDVEVNVSMVSGDPVQNDLALKVCNFENQVPGVVDAVLMHPYPSDVTEVYFSFDVLISDAFSQTGGAVSLGANTSNPNLSLLFLNSGVLSIQANTTTNIIYSLNEWINIELICNINSNSTEVIIDGNSITTVQFSYGTGSTAIQEYTGLKIDSGNPIAPGTLYFDNLCQGYKSINCQDIDPVLDCPFSFDDSNCDGGEAPIACYNVLNHQNFTSFSTCIDDPSYQYKWYRNGEFYSTESGISFNFLDNPGIIELVIENDCGISSYAGGSCYNQEIFAGGINHLPIFNPDQITCEPSQCINDPYAYSINLGTLDFPSNVSVSSSESSCNNQVFIQGNGGDYCASFPSPGCYLICFEWDCTSDGGGVGKSSMVTGSCPTRLCKTICVPSTSLDCSDYKDLECNTSDDWSTKGLPDRVNQYNCDAADGSINNFVTLLGGERIYRFKAPRDGDYTFELSNIDNGEDLDMFFLYDCEDHESCFNSTDGNPNAPDKITMELDASVFIYIVVDTDTGSGSDFTIEVSCPSEFCDDIVVNEELTQDNYVVFDNPMGLNIQYYEVAYPLDSLDTDGDYETLDSIAYTGGTLDYYCPRPGCYYICFWYLNTEGQLESCCIKYCASFRNYDCVNYPRVNYNDYVENEDGTITCSFNCVPPNELFTVQNASDTSYIEIVSADGMLVDTVQEGELVTLPYGQYRVCCWVYDPVCDYWDVCCKPYCFPYIPESQLCNPPLFTQSTNASNVFTYTPPGDITELFTVTPNLPENNLYVDSPDMAFFGTHVFEVNIPGVYKICGDYCCQYICYDGEDNTEPESCFDIEYIEDDHIELTCSKETVLNWRITALCECPPGTICTCDYFDFYGSRVNWQIPYPGEFEICKQYYGCCGEIETCCETICYNPFTPPLGVEGGGFNECEDIMLNGWNFIDGHIYGDFTYMGSESEVGAEWEIYITNDSGGFSRDKSGSNGMNFNTYDDTYQFTEGQTYYICYTYIDANGCKQYCCIKVEVPIFGSCSPYVVPTFTGNDTDLTFSFDYDGLDSNEEIMQWYVEDSGNIGTGTNISYTFDQEGIYNIYLLIYNNQTRCYRLCCFKFCCQNPLGCNDIIIESYDPFTGAYDLGLSANAEAVEILEWQIDLPSEFAGTKISDPDYFIPADYGIPADTKIWVSVKFRDVDGCIKICCIMLCSTGGGTECKEPCYEDCCPNSDKSWLEEIKNMALQDCQSSICFQNGIAQAQWNGQCVYALGQCGDRPGTVYNCQGVELFVFGGQADLNLDLKAELTNMQLIWSCSGGDIPPCGQTGCDTPNPISCETFEAYQVDTPIEDRDNWSNSSPGSLFVSEDLGNNYLVIQSHNGADANAKYDLTTVSTSGSVVRLSYDLWLPNVPNQGIVTSINDGEIQINLQPTESGETGVNLITSSFQTTDANGMPGVAVLDYNYEEWIKVEVILNTRNGGLEIRINDTRVGFIASSGIFKFIDFYVDTQLLSDNNAGRLDNICLDSCGSIDECYDDCCAGIDKSWINDIITNASLANMECDNNTANTIISQCQYEGECYYEMIYIPCFDPSSLIAPLPTVYEFYSCDGSVIPVPDNHLVASCTVIWDYHNGYVPPCDDDEPCEYMGTQICEDIEAYTVGSEINDEANWSDHPSDPSWNSLVVATDGQNQYLEGMGNSIGSNYSIPSVTGDEQKLSMDLYLSSQSQMFMYFSNNQDEFELQFNAPNSSIPHIAIWSSTGVNVNSKPYPTDQWFELSLIYSASKKDLYIHINGSRIMYLANFNISRFEDVSFAAGLQNNDTIRIDDICISSCAPCPPDTEPDFDCDILSITQILPVEDEYSVTFSANAESITKWEIIDNETNDVLNPNNQNTANAYGYGSFVAGKTYIICVYYLDEEGCERVCCIKLAIPSSCSTHTYESNESDFEYVITDNNTDDQLELMSTWISGSNLGSEASITYDFGSYGQYYICCLYYNPVLKCYSLCCTPICIQEPSPCEGIFTVDYAGDMSNPFMYDITFDESIGQDFSWFVDGQYHGTAAPQQNMFDLTYQAGQSVEICLRYFNYETGCYERCCITVCVENPYEGCDLIDVQGDPSNGLEVSSTDFPNARWYIDGIGYISTGMLSIDLNDSNIQGAINSEGYLYVCMQYFDGTCYRTCSLPICTVASNASCDLLDVSYVIDGSDFVFTIDHSDMVVVSCEVVLPDNSTQDISASDSFTTDIAGTYTFRCEYQDGCGGNLVCEKEVCVTEPLNCVPFTVEIDMNNLATFTHEVSGGVTYTWDFGDGSDLVVDNSSTITHQYPEGIETYFVSLTVVDICGDICFQSLNTDTNQINVSSEFDNPTCGNLENGSILINVTGGVEPISIEWSTGDTDVNTIGNLSAGNYSVTVTDAEDRESILNFELTTPDLIEFTSNIEDTSCGLDNGSLQLMSTNDVSISMATLNGVPVDVSQTIEGLAANSYTLSVTDENGCIVEDQIQIEESELPELTIGEDISLCQGTSVNLDYNSDSDFVTFAWTEGGTMLGNDPTLTVTTAGTYTLTAETEDGCIADDQIVVSVLEALEFSTEVTNTSCGLNNGSLTVTNTNGITITNLSITDLQVNVDQNVIEDLPSGEHLVIITDINGCISETMIEIAASQEESLDIGEQATICSNESFSLFSLVPEDLSSVQWSSDGQDLSEEEASNVSQSGTYTITATNMNGCIVSDNFTLEVLPALINTEEQIIQAISGEEISLSVDGAVSSNWVSPSYELSCSDCLETTLIANETGTVVVTSTDVNACSYTIGYTINVDQNENEGPVSGPNMMTPNGDNINDNLIFNGLEDYENNTLVIFNRWGKIIYETDSYNNDWMAIYNGDPLPDGTYYYVLRYGTTSSKEFTLSRDLLIIRER